jgi:hypothetical protein
MHDINIAHSHEVTSHDFVGCCLNCRRSFDIIKRHVIDFSERISGASDERLAAMTPEELYQTFQLLDDIAHLEVGDELAESILRDAEIARRLPPIRRYYTRFFDLHERHLARSILRAPNPWGALESFALYPRYEILLANHARAAGITGRTRLAFLGCGPVALSAALLARWYSVRSVAIDVDPQAVETARRCIDRLGLSDPISVVHGDESVLADVDWDLTIVAALAEPKKRIFRKLRRITGDDPSRRISYRTYSGMRAVLYRPVAAEEIAGFQVTAVIPPSGRVNNTVVMVEPA